MKYYFYSKINFISSRHSLISSIYTTVWMVLLYISLIRNLHSLTVENLHAWLLKIYQVIFVYRSILPWLWRNKYFIHTLRLTNVLKIAGSSLNLNQWIYSMSQNDFFEPLILRQLSFIRVYTQLIWQAFLHIALNTPKFLSLLNKFEAWFSCVQLQQFVMFMFGLSFWFLKMEYNPLPDLLNTIFTIIDIGLLCGGEHRKQKYADS